MSEIRLLRQIQLSVERYQQAVYKPWFCPAKMTLSLLIAAAVTVTIATFANSWVRANQLEIWRANQELGFIDGTVILHH